MYFTRVPRSKPWKAARNYACFFPDKMQSERHTYCYRKFGRSAILNEDTNERWRKMGNDPVFIRQQRRQQRRFNRWLCDPFCSEWD